MKKENAYVTIGELGEYIGQEVALAGWVVTLRSSGKILFLVLRDGTGICQGVLEKTAEHDALFDSLSHLGQESSIEMKGVVRVESRAPGGYELAVSGGRVIGESRDFPITPKEHGIDFLLRQRHLWLRSSRQTAIMRIRDTVTFAIREFFHNREFKLVDTPIFAPSVGEGASTLFEVDYFGQPVYLAQTGQLYLESAAMALRKVYCFGPTFRAEKSKTRRHLTEFWMVEPEVAFIDLDGLLELAEDFICSIVGKVLEKNRSDLELLGRDIGKLEKVQKPFARVTYSEAVEILHGSRAEKLLRVEYSQLEKLIAELEAELEASTQQQATVTKAWQKDKLGARIIEIRDQLAEARESLKNIPLHLELAKGFNWGKDLGGSDETIISKLHERPVFVTHYPRMTKAFYMRQDRANEQVVENFDLLAPEGVGEIIGGSVREEELDRLLARMKEEGLATEPYEWYLDLRRYGSVPHGGFGLGIERTLGWICGLKHIREAIAFPRMMGKVYP
ncbi:MAG: asparagine--tRNA ligase [Phycisphaerae bacterium]|nr:asparagine--tRNA ligase [Phycisphaerae bacterium]